MTSSQNLNKALDGDLSTLFVPKPTPRLSVKRIGVISRDYRETGGNSDFSDCIEEVLEYCDLRQCDTVLFSLYTILKSKMYMVERSCEKLRNIKSLFIEEFSFEDGKKYAGNMHCFYKKNDHWKDHVFNQKFATVKHTDKFEKQFIRPFIKEIATQRLFDNLTVLLCGEINAVKYDKEKKTVTDHYGLLKAIPSETWIILNPVHDKMTRFEMKLKRAFLSNKNRLAISVWNKGKTDNRGICRDGKNPPWTIYSNGKEINLFKENISPLDFPDKGLEIGILNINSILDKQ